jgi:ABC-type nitrate/sulfonate/bicarbonate transport system ATPase subunit
MSAASHLQFQSVTKSFGAPKTGRIEVLTPIDLEIAKGEFVVFLGPSGCGKTTLMRMVGGLDVPTGGRILLDGEPVARPDRRRGMVFQSYSSFPWLTVAQNVAFGMRYRADLSAAEKAERTRHYLSLVGLADFADAYPKRISGGMRQRVAIARTLASGSEILLMDEPFGALDAQTREFLQDQLLRIQRREAKTVIFVTHDVEEAVFLADRIVVFSARPARVLEIVDVNAAIGPERTFDTKEGEAFFRLRNHVLHLIRDQARHVSPELAEAAQ